MFARTLSLSGIVAAQQSDSIFFLLYQPIGFVIFLISGILRKTIARHFDLPEAEIRLVAGFHTEYSGFRWSLFFMAEYGRWCGDRRRGPRLSWWLVFSFVYRLTEAKGFHNAYVVVSLMVFLATAGVLLYSMFGCAGRCRAFVTIS